MLRDQAKARTRKLAYGFFTLGWRVPCGNGTTTKARWHTTVFPLSFVAGAIYSGFAMVLTLTVISSARQASAAGIPAPAAAVARPGDRPPHEIRTHSTRSQPLSSLARA